MRQDARSSAIGKQFAALAIERLFAPQRSRALWSRLRFAALLALCLLVHLAVLWRLLREDSLDVEQMTRLQEIPVEVVVEPPPEAKEEPPAPKEEPPKPKEEPKPQKQEMSRDVEPAVDAPKEANKEKVERETAEEEMKASRVAPPPEEAAPKSEPPQAPEDAHREMNKPEPDSAAKEQIEDKPEAEIIKPSEPAPKSTPEEKQTQKEAKPAPKKGEAKSIAEQIASLAPLPEMKFGTPAKPSPIGGGNAKTTYLSILYGLIMPKMRIPPGTRQRPAIGRGEVVFFIDDAGNLTHQAIEQSSGIPELDAAALRAVRAAAPFPAPPRGHPHAMVFSYAPK